MNQKTKSFTKSSEGIKRFRQVTIMESFKKTKLGNNLGYEEMNVNCEVKSQASPSHFSSMLKNDGRACSSESADKNNHGKNFESKFNSNEISAESETLEYDLSQSLFSDDDVVSLSGADISLGMSISLLRRKPDCCADLPALKPSPNHTMLFRPHFLPLKAPQPFPDLYKDKWDNDHVRMPCSQENLYPVEDGKGIKKLENRWNIIKKALQAQISSSYDLEEAIMKYNARYNNKWNFTALHCFFTEVLDNGEKQYFFGNLLPAMINLALQLPEICTKPIPLLRCHRTHSLTLSQKQIACLLANAFFCTFPRRNAQRRQSEYASFPDINFNGLFIGIKNGLNPRVAEKLKCIFHYFSRVTEKEPVGCVTFHRQHISEPPQWENSKAQLPGFHTTSKGTIEEDGIGMLQVDFANKFIGGGVLKRGCVQEEIRFVICPELIISRLFTEMLEADECLIITGCEQFSKYVGYADNFKWAGNYDDKTFRDSWNRRCTEIVAIDAIHFRTSRDQYLPKWLKREINKAFCGFYSPDASKNLAAVATGNWGCGVYRGDPHLKSLLQLMAAAEAGRELLYFTFHNPQLCDEIYKMYSFLTARKITVGELWKILLQFHEYFPSGRKSKKHLYEFIRETLQAYDAETDSDKSADDQKSLPHCKRNSDILLNEDVDNEDNLLLNLYETSEEHS